MSILFWLYRSRINKSGTVPIMMRITINSKRISFSTNLAVELSAWDQNKQRVKGNSELVKEYNNLLLTLTTAAWNVYNDGFRRKILLEPKTIRDVITKTNTHASTLVEAIQFHLSNLKARAGFDISINTVKKYVTLNNKIKMYLSIQIKRNDISLQEVNRQFVSEFDLYMRTVEKLKHNAVIKNMQQFRHVEGLDYELTLVFNLDIKHNAVASKDRTSLFIDKPEFQISTATGKKILEWCNSGKEITIEERINESKSIGELLELFKSATVSDQENYQSAFSKKREQLQPKNNQSLKPSQNGTTTSRSKQQ